MKLIDVSALKEWTENWFTKNRLYHPYAKNNNIPITELYDILEQMPSAQPEVKVLRVPYAEKPIDMFDALSEEEKWQNKWYAEGFSDAFKELSAQPEYYDYSDIDDVWEFYAEEQDINLTGGAKQLKDAMWVGYRKGKQDAQPEIIRCKDCKYKHIENMVWTCPFGLPGGELFFCAYGAERRTDDLQ